MTTFEAEWRARFERFGRGCAEEHHVSGWSREGLARRVRLFEWLLDELALPGQARVLELGCGAGTYVRFLAGRGHTVVGLDYAVPSLGRAVAADPGRKGRYLAADGFELPFRAECFDLVVCIGVLQAVSRVEALLVEIARVLRPGALLVLETLNAWEAPALVRRLAAVARRRSPRVRTHSLSALRRALNRHGIRGCRRIGVYLPPRRLPALGWIFDRRPVVSVLERTPGAALATAHAFWVVGAKVA